MILNFLQLILNRKIRQSKQESQNNILIKKSHYTQSQIIPAVWAICLLVQPFLDALWMEAMLTSG